VYNFNGCQSSETNALDEALGVDEIIIGDLILTEVENYRRLRQQGITVRKTIDVMLSMIALFKTCVLSMQLVHFGTMEVQ